MTTKAADQKHCFSCGAIIHISSPTCPGCGAAQPAINYAVQPVTNPSPPTTEESHMVPPSRLPPNHIFCRGCGQPIHETARSCPKCGALQRVAENPFQTTAGGRSRIAAALFAFFLGGIGGHKFYLGSPGMGILYLLFFWTFIPAFVSFIEGILLLTMSDENFQRKYN